MSEKAKKVQPLRAADLGYTWDPRLPDGTTWTGDADGEIELWTSMPEPGERYWRGNVAAPGSGVPSSIVAWLGLTPPDFGDRPWTECVLIKGQEPPELPPCPPGDGWIEWGGGE